MKAVFREFICSKFFFFFFAPDADVIQVFVKFTLECGRGFLACVNGGAIGVLSLVTAGLMSLSIWWRHFSPANGTYPLWCHLFPPANGQSLSQTTLFVPR